MDDIDDALSYAKYNFEGVIAGFRVQKKERLKEENKRKDKKPEEFKHLTLFAAQHLSDEIKNYCHAYGDYNHATVWAASFLNEMVSECERYASLKAGIFLGIVACTFPASSSVPACKASSTSFDTSLSTGVSFRRSNGT